MNSEEMPKLLPLPIRTKGVFYLKALLRWFFSIRKWEVLDNWYYTLRDGCEIVVPKDFIFDGASIPRIFWAVLSPVGLLLIPGLIHDYAYKYDMLWEVKENGEVNPYKKGAGKLYWDGIFRDTAIDVNSFKIINRIAWLALLVGGWFSWWGHRKNEEEPEKPVVPAPENYDPEGDDTPEAA